MTFLPSLRHNAEREFTLAVPSYADNGLSTDAGGFFTLEAWLPIYIILCMLVKYKFNTL